MKVRESDERGSFARTDSALPSLLSLPLQSSLLQSTTYLVDDLRNESVCIQLVYRCLDRPDLRQSLGRRTDSAQGLAIASTGIDTRSTFVEFLEAFVTGLLCREAVILEKDIKQVGCLLQRWFENVCVADCNGRFDGRC